MRCGRMKKERFRKGEIRRLIFGCLKFQIPVRDPRQKGPTGKWIYESQL